MYVHLNVRTGDALLIATEKLKQSGLIYSLRLDMVINRLRFAKILSIANKLFGATGVAVLEELAVHGRYGIIHCNWLYFVILFISLLCLFFLVSLIRLYLFFVRYCSCLLYSFISLFHYLTLNLFITQRLPWDTI